MSGIKPPKNFVINSELDMAQEWTEWIELFTHYSNSIELTKKTAEIQASTLISCLGRPALKVLNNLGATDDEKKNPKQIIDKLKNYFAPSRNKTYERYQFHRIKQEECESFEDFLQRLKTQVTRCGYSTKEDEFVMDQIVVGIRNENTRQKMWVEDDMELAKAVKICRAAERAEKQIKSLSDLSTPTHTQSSSVNKINKKDDDEFDCKRCGTRHGKKQCPAFNKKCEQCGNNGHFKKMCRSRKKSSENKSKNKKDKYKKSGKVKKIVSDSSETDSDSSSESEYNYVSSIKCEKEEIKVCSIKKDKWIETLKVGGGELVVDLDTGAHCNVISRNEASRLKLRVNSSSTKRLSTYSLDTVKVIGETKVWCVSPQKSGQVIFKVINEDLMSILGRHSCEELGLVQRVHKVDIQLGCYNNYEYDIDFVDNPKFKIIPPRRIPAAIRDKTKEELDRMVTMKVLAPVTEPSPAVSPMLVVEKNGKIRVCMDPVELNKNIKRRHYPLNTVEEIAAKVGKAKFFTKLDCKHGFWQIKVTERTSKYLVISTPWGRYRYLRMPFGINSAPEVFSQIMNETLQGIDNCEVAMDDIFLYAETKERLEGITKKVTHRLKDAGFTLNHSKCEYNKNRVKFLGHVFTSNGCEIDPDKVSAVHRLNTPANVKELQRLLGTVTYLAKFIPKFSDLTEPLRRLIVKDTAWVWDVDQQAAFEKLKEVITTTPVLGYYDVNQSVKISCDASSVALGACLLQNEKPIAYASRALTKAEKNYPPIGREAAAIGFACKKFHYYVYGKKLDIETDHKPLETIFKKPISQAPMRLQQILFDVLPYSPTVQYKKGVDMKVADTLSRDCKAEPIDKKWTESEEYKINAVFAMSDVTKNHLAKLTDEDFELQMLRTVVERGWPTDDSKLPEAVKPYASFKEEIWYDGQLLFKANKIIIPIAERPKVLADIHKGHPGVSKSLARARSSLYWPRLTNEIKELVEKCSTCQRTQRAKTKEPLLQKVLPDYPFQLVSTDMFMFKGKDYIIIADHYSGFMDFQEVKSTTSAAVILQFKKWFAIHGIPETLESDGGPQFASNEFKMFALRWQFNHRISSPHYARSNGFAERNVQTAKNLLRKCWHGDSDIYEALLMLRNTPRNDILGSQCQRLFSRRTRTFIPIRQDDLKPQIISGVTKELARLRFQQKTYADRVSSPFKQLELNEKVRLQKGHRDWVSAKVVEKSDNPRSVIVETTTGKRYRRNTIHLQRSSANIQDVPEVDINQDINESTDSNLTSNQVSNELEIGSEAIPQPKRSLGVKSQQTPAIHISNQQDNQQKTTRSGRVIKTPKRYQL